MIQVRDLVMKFGDLAAVDHVSFEVRTGEIFAFLGPNGAGKTTTIKMLTTLLTPTGGEVTIDGLDPSAHPHEARSRFGIVFQDPSLDGDMTAEENMELHAILYRVPRKLRQARIEQAVEPLDQPEHFDAHRVVDENAARSTACGRPGRNVGTR